MRRARHDGDHRDHRAEHRRRDAVDAVAPELIVAQVRAVQRDIGVDAVKIGMLGTRRDDRGRRAGARPARARHADRARPGDGRRVRRRAARAGGARARSSSGCCRAPPSSRRTCPRRARSSAGRARRGASVRDPAALDAPALARAIHALGPRVRRRHRRAPRRGHRRLLRRRDARRDPRRAPPRRRRARLGLHALLGARGAPRARLHAARGGARARRPSPPPPSATACARSAQAPGPSTCSGVRGRRPRLVDAAHNPLP